jgi:hypothetical protein
MPCDDRLRLLIHVASAPGNSEHRQAIRDTWGYAVPIRDAKLLFFLGHGNGWPPGTTVSDGLANMTFEVVKTIRIYIVVFWVMTLCIVLGKRVKLSLCLIN